MTRAIVRAWQHLGLMPRLALACGAVLAGLVFVSIAAFVGAEVERQDRGNAERVASDVSLLAAAVSAYAARDDRPGVTRLLAAFAQRPGVERVIWIDAHGNALGADGPAVVPIAPAWFEAWARPSGHSAGMPVEAAGSPYGKVWLRLGPTSALDEIWSAVLAQAGLLLGGVAAILLVLVRIVWRGLRPLARLSAAVGRFGAGDHSVRVEPAGTAEVSAGIRAFNAMAAEVETLFETLRESESKNRRLAMIVEQSSDSIMTCDLDGTITSWNPGAQRLFGWSAAQAIGRPLRALQFRGISDAAHARLLAHVRSGQTSLGEGARVDKSGATLQVSATHAPLLDESGRVIGAIAVARDVTELKLAQQGLLRANEKLELRVRERTAELDHNEMLLRAVMDAMPGVIAFQDPQRRFQWFNRKLEQTLELPAAAIRGRTPAELMRPENACISRPFMDRAQAGEAVRFEWSYAHADGRVDELDTSFVPVIGADGSCVGVAAFSIDVTVRKRAEAALRDSQARNRELATMVTRSNDAIHVRNLEGKVTFWNQGSERLTGFSSAEAIGQPLRALHLIDKTDPEIEAILRRIRSGTATDFEARRSNKSGQTIDVAIRTEPLFDEAGQLSGEVVVTRDITATRLAERELRHAKEAAEAANRAKSEFLANMSHEIRTPLSGLLGITDLVLDSPLTPEQRADLELVKLSGNSLATLIDDILDFSKIEAGHLHLEAIEFAPADNIADTLRVLGPRAAAKGIGLVYDPRELPALLRGDPGRLRQVVTNLVGNAIKFTSRGEVCVGVCAQALPDGQRLLRVQVRDTGIGIPADKHASIFDAFSQADTSISRRYGGSGLGLSISARLARLMGGDLRVESEPGKGSCFSFSARFGPVERAGSAAPASGAHTLEGRPVRSIEDAAPAARVPRHRLRETRQGEAILVAEDNEINQMLARRVLEKLGHTVHIVDSGQAALDALDALPGEAFALVLMDMQMPGMGGLEAAAAIRQREAGGPTRIPIVALTANALVGDREACLSSGMDDYLTKPFSAEQLSGVLRRWLPGGAAPVPAGGGERTDFGSLASDAIGATGTTGTSSGRLDVEVLKGYVGDDDATVEEFLRSFLASAGKAGARLARGHGGRSADAIAEVAHQLKSTARTVGAMALGERCAVLESAARSLDWAGIDAALPRLHRLLDSAAADAEAWLAAHVPLERPA